MKLKVKRAFRYQFNAATTKDIAPGIYDVPKDISREIADSILKFGKAEIVSEKVAPENKVVTAPESKQEVGRKPVSGRGTRSKSKKRKAT